MSDSTKAVFLSYASQDAAAAKRICESLRVSGVAVWFDVEGGLETGDEWDQKIRRQIKECVLFIAVISKNTQARHEGYFRFEWDLAAERARGIASGVAFILPVVIDDTREPEALVPDRFRAVQWTRLPGGEVSPEVQARFAKLWSQRAGVVKHAELDAERPAEAGKPRPAQRDGGVASPTSQTNPAAGRRFPAASGEPALQPQKRVLFATAIAALLAGAGWWLLHDSSPKSASASVATVRAPAPASATKPASTPTAADQLVGRAYAQIEKMNFTRANLAAAEDLARKATELASDSAHAWGARAYVQSTYVLRGWDSSQQRREAAQDAANRALALDPNEIAAMLALTYVFNQQRAFAQSEAIARRGLLLRPDDSRLRRVLGTAINGAGRAEEAFAIRRENVRLFPREPLIYYDLALMQRAQQDFDGALASFEAALALQPFASAQLHKTMLTASYRGDLPAARATLDQVAPEERSEDRAVGVAEWLALLEHRSNRVIEAAALTARVYLDEPIFRGAKASWVALAYQLDGKTALAREQWETAEAVLRRRLTDPAATPVDRALRAITLAWLGRTEEGGREIAAFEAAASEQAAYANAPPPQVLLAFFYAALGDAAKAVPYARQSLNRSHFISDHTFPIDPQWDKIRGTPEFAALLAEAKARIQK